jgi:hypothetical protein
VSNERFKAIDWAKRLLGIPLPASVVNGQILSDRGSQDISLSKRLGTLSSLGEIMRAMIKAASGMVNIIQYDFEWRDLPLNKDTQIFLTTTRNAFDTSLCKLILSAQVSKFAELLTLTKFEGLEELEFHF